MSNGSPVEFETTEAPTLKKINASLTKPRTVLKSDTLPAEVCFIENVLPYAGIGMALGKTQDGDQMLYQELVTYRPFAPGGICRNFCWPMLQNHAKLFVDENLGRGDDRFCQV